MLEPVVIVWTVLALIFGFIFLFALKKKKRTKDKYAKYLLMLIVFITFGISFLLYFYLQKNPHAWVWTSRLALLVLGGINLWIIYKRPWTKRNGMEYSEDSFLLEFLFTAITGLICCIAFVYAPRLVPKFDFNIDISPTLWDLPILFVLPFLFLKLIDLSGHVPLKVIENPWVYPLEKVNPSDWPWRELKQVNFEVKKSLLEEYDLFTSSTKPWIEGPKEVSLGNVFQLCIQERRLRKDLSTIQDMGDEYGGTAKFCWLFYKKFIWYNPMTWFPSDKYLNPDLSIVKNNIKKGDVIIAKRIAGDGTRLARSSYEDVGDDPNKTVFIQR